MALTIRDTNITPRPDKWRYPGVDGTDLTASSYMNLKREVAQHYRANGQEPPDEAQLQDWLCRNVRVHCFEGTREFKNHYTHPPKRLNRGQRHKEWPLILQPLKAFAKETDRGLGDIAERVIGKIGGDQFKKWHYKIFGRPCSCGERQDLLNEEFPL